MSIKNKHTFRRDIHVIFSNFKLQDSGKFDVYFEGELEERLSFYIFSDTMDTERLAACRTRTARA